MDASVLVYITFLADVEFEPWYTTHLIVQQLSDRHTHIHTPTEVGYTHEWLLAPVCYVMSMLVPLCRTNLVISLHVLRWYACHSGFCACLQVSPNFYFASCDFLPVLEYKCVVVVNWREFLCVLRGVTHVQYACSCFVTLMNAAVTVCL